MAEIDDWQPPTEAEMKVIQAKRERSDKISKLMGDYLLKGYKMLGTSCSTCLTILLRDKQNKDYCVACNELDTEHAKDNPVLSEAAARSIVQEGQRPHEVAHNGPINGSERVTETSAVKRKLESPKVPYERNQRLPTHRSNNDELSSKVQAVVDDSMEGVCEKLAWAREELRASNSIEVSLKICELMKLCAETIVTLKKAGPSEL
ncbi:protein ZNRD2-like [Anneissia japonica]|uniref:protein ZNRD2-like n=1 Tax=Anneissia japonica TaxID=1529436 RepID=UPI0014254D8E|nr:protein ZNRD2-like [Anneissia japonica]XP_033124843.1 protein ZNRD2-like [Anneissia japonica]XP_033124844.1 protein ZNRD2-like [Anneissia japonica]